MQETKQITENLEAERRHLKSYYPFYAANEVMYRNGAGTKREFLRGDIVVSSALGLFSSGLFAWGVRRARKSNEDSGGPLSMVLKIAGVRLLGQAMWIFLKSWTKLRKAKSKEKEVASAIYKHSELFQQDKEGNFIIFDNPEQGTQLLLDKNDSFISEGSIDYNQHEFPSTIPQYLHFLYQRPSKDSFGGKFSGWDMVVDGSEDFRGNKVYIGGEILYINDGAIGFLNVKYNLMLSARSMYKPYFKKFEGTGNLDHDTLLRKEHEINIINSCRNVLSIDLDHSPFIRKDIKEKYEFIDIGTQAITHKSGVCRHQAIYLAFFLQRAKQEGYLSGTIRFESRCPIELNGDGHSWITYFMEGISDPLVIDPVNKICQFRSAITNPWKEFFDKWYDAKPSEKNYKTLLRT